MQVCGRTPTPALLAQIQSMADAGPSQSRRTLSRRLCERFEWRDARGRPKVMSCRKALAHHARLGNLDLAPARQVFGARVEAAEPTLRAHLDSELLHFDGTLAELGAVSVEPVTDRRHPDSALWRLLMERFHPLGAGPLCGAQVRYLARTNAGAIVGALAFSAAAWHLQPRDGWIGWDEAHRRRNLQLIVNNSRFLVAGTVRCPNLASHVLSRAVGRLGDDWESQYGYRPVLLETFVDSTKHDGTCYRAAGFTCLGETAGRGRQDRDRRAPVQPKWIFVRPLQSNWRTVLYPGGQAHDVALPAATTRTLDWAEVELGRAAFGDRRLTRRLLILARDFFANISAVVAEASRTEAAARGAYRFFSNEKVTMPKILEPHWLATAERAGAAPVVLAVQDSTALNYSDKGGMAGLGPLTSKTGGCGIWLHDTVAFTPAGTPLGVIDAQVWSRDFEPPPSPRGRRKIEEKESMRWLTSYRKACALADACPNARVVSVCDREGDIFELFDETRQPHHRADLLVRLRRGSKRAEGEAKLFELLPKEESLGSKDIDLPRGHGQRKRSVTLHLRLKEVAITPPQEHRHLAAMKAWAIHVSEDAQTATGTPLEWLLLSTTPTTTVEEAWERVQWYRARWWIEVFHRTIKSGCEVERHFFETTEALHRCLAVDLVTAWRVMHITMAARESPDEPASTILDEEEWQALQLFTTGTIAPTPQKNKDALRAIASMGGFRARKVDGNPGTTSIWRGVRVLEAYTLGVRHERQRHARQPSTGPP